MIESTPKYDRKVTFLTQQIYFKSEGRFKIILHEDLMPFISEIKGKFTKYSLKYIAKFNSFHSIRLYEILAQYRSMVWREITVVELKNWLQVADKYDRWDNFKQWVLTPSIKEINEKSDLLIEIEQIKRGRAIYALKFIIKEKEQLKEKLSEKQKQQKQSNLDLFGKFSDIERTVIQGRIAEHIARLEAKGEIISDFHRQNINKKAVNERWGLDILAVIQEQQQQKDEYKAIEKLWQETPNNTHFRHKIDGSIWSKEAGLLIYKSERDSRVVPEGQVINIFKHLEKVPENEQS